MKRKKRLDLFNLHADQIDKEEELEPDFTWQMKKSHLNDDKVFLAGSFELKELICLLQVLQTSGYNKAYLSAYEMHVESIDTE